MNVGDVVDGKYLVQGVCSTDGGMGDVLFVTVNADPSGDTKVLKFCKVTDPKLLERFKREVSLLSSFKGNSRVAQILGFNIAHDPPYYVMDKYDSDLTKMQGSLANDPALQEGVFCQMIDCIAELHARRVYHRDIKPQNFLVSPGWIVVSDMGLGIEVELTTKGLTSTGEWAGTIGYMPPESFTEGFHNSDAPGDIFMLGKSFYALMTGRTAAYMTPQGIPAGVYHVLERACSTDKARRYQTLADLKQAIVAAYDIVLNRVQGVDQTSSRLTGITSQYNSLKTYDPAEIEKFVADVGGLAEDEQDMICQRLDSAFFLLLSQAPLATVRRQMLTIYEGMVSRGRFAWAFAETVATCMRVIVLTNDPTPAEKAMALDIAINAAISQNRFAAMSTCESLITSIEDNDLAALVQHVIAKYADSFLANIELVRCKSDIIRTALRKLKKPTSPAAPSTGDDEILF